MSAKDAVDVPIPATPAITLDKTAAAPSAVAKDGTIAYTFAVTNTGNVTLGSIAISDPKVGTVSCPVATLLPGESTTCTASYTLTQADVDAGTVHNDANLTATRPATATEPSPDPLTASDSDDVPVAAAPAITIDKSHAALSGTAVAGTPVSYSFLVTNTGNVTLTSVNVTDPTVGTVTCPVTSLAPTDTTTCTATYNLTQADVDAGVVNNTAQAHGTPPATAANLTPSPVDGTDIDTLALPPVPSIDLVKSHAALTGTAQAGTVVTYNFAVTNTGNVTLHAVSVADPKVGTVTCPVTVLAPTASTTCTASYALTQADVDAGVVDNTATAQGTQPITATYPEPDPVTDASTDSLPIDRVASLDFDKQGSTPTTMAAGGTIAYTFLVTNTGNVTLSKVTVTDPKVGPVTCPTATLLPTESVTCTASYKLTQADVDAGKVDNTATAGADVPPGVTALTPKSDSVTTPIPPTVKLTMEKYDNVGTKKVAAGDTINYTFVVTNAGNVTVSGIAVNDPKLASVTCPVTTLKPGESVTCVGAPYTVTTADQTSGKILNTATLTASECGESAGPVKPTAACPVLGVTASRTTLTASLRGYLAVTGFDGAIAAGLGALALASGVALVAVVRRRRSA